MDRPSLLGKKRGRADGPPYARYALLNPYNLTLLLGSVVVSVATDNLWLAVCAAAAETVWLLFAPESTLLRRLWFDKTWEANRKADEDDRLAEKLTKLEASDGARANALREQRLRIERLAAENRSFASDLMAHELAKLDGLIEDFVDLGVTAGRCARHQASFDFQTMGRAWRQYSNQVETLDEDDPRREIAVRNVGVLEQRRKRFDDLARTLQTARGQMDLIENSFRLLADEIVSMGNPAELGQRLDDLRIAVDAIRETVEGMNDDDGFESTARGTVS
jgi:hypothetical protein